MSNAQNNEKRFVYFYFNRNEPEKIRQVVPAHIQYWRAANVKGYMGGPFGDRTGGLISFLAPDLPRATDFILQDPFILEDLILEKWIKEWILEQNEG
jgi:hypothetical protein